MSTNKLALHFGAGNIGRGFICPELKKNNYDVIFVDVNQDLVDNINLNKHYKITSITKDSTLTDTISDISAINFTDSALVNKFLIEADLVTTSVGPKYVDSVYKLLINSNTTKDIFFIAFENQYRSSTKTAGNSYESKNIISIDAVVDKIVPPQIDNSLDVIVEKYGSIVIDSIGYRPLAESDIVGYGDYEVEFLKKLWLLNGLHLQLAYYGISNEKNYIHEIFQDEILKVFAADALDALSNAFMLKTNYKNSLTEFKESILQRFSLPELKDEVLRVARNPLLKFSKNERFHGPLDVLINKDLGVHTFKAIIDLLLNNSFANVEDYKNFNNFTNDGLEKFLVQFWELSSNEVNQYKERLI